MRSPKDLYPYQHKATTFLSHTAQSMLWLDMGLGKTVVTLTNVVQRQDLCQVYGTLVVAPLRVIQSVWRQEAKRWAHTKHLRFSLIHGSVRQRKLAFYQHADVYLVNYEGLKWLSEQMQLHYLSKGKTLPFNMIVFDEVSKLKNHTTVRHKALRKILPFIPYRIGLTGTPAANGYIDLFGQYLAVDSGARLGTTRSHFTQAFFKEKGWGVASRYEIFPGAETRIQELISDITLQMSAKDYLDLPPIIFNDIWVELPSRARILYEELEREMFATLDSGTEVEVFNPAALTCKCLQVANGALYTEVGGPWEAVHEAKLDALDDVLEEANGKPILGVYAFVHDAIRIQERHPATRLINSKLNENKLQVLLNEWDRGEVPLMIGHPDSLGHGLNLQHGSDTLVFMGLPWSLERYLQTIDRLAGGLRRHRSVIVHRILARDTTDVVVREVLKAKAVTQADLKAALNEYRHKKLGGSQSHQRTHPGADSTHSEPGLPLHGAPPFVAQHPILRT